MTMLQILTWTLLTGVCFAFVLRHSDAMGQSRGASLFLVVLTGFLFMSFLISSSYAWLQALP